MWRRCGAPGMRRWMHWWPGWRTRRPIRCCAAPARRRCGPGWVARPPSRGGGLDAVLGRVIEDVLPYAAGTNHPGYFAFIPYFTTWPAAVAELIATAANVSPWAWMESPAATQIELEVIDWFRGWLGMPEGTAGVLVSGGSDRKSTRLNSSHMSISYAVFCLKKKIYDAMRFNQILKIKAKTEKRFSLII